MRQLLESSEAAQWRCLLSKPKSEHLAARHLAAEGWETYCPRVRHQRKTARGLVWFVEALFPNYIFAKFCIEESRQIRSARFVRGMLDFTADCGVVDTAAIMDLQAHFPDADPFTVEIVPAPGDNVELADGAFRGVSAVVTRLLPGAQRAQILLDFLGSPRHMEVPLHSLISFHDPRVTAFSRATAHRPASEAGLSP
jgi:transcriptional antiterminator RfaH